MNPKDNVDLAKVLNGPPKGAPAEASFRAACGRAYYGAYAHVRDVLNAAGFAVPPDATGHAAAITLLKRSTDNNVRGAGGLLEQLRIERNEADYDVGARVRRAFIQKHSQFAVLKSHSVISTIDTAASKSKKVFI